MRFLAVIFLLVSFLTSVSVARPGETKISTIVKRVMPKLELVLPKIKQQIAGGSKVAVGAVCLATFCALQFFSPAAAASLDGLSTRSELLSRRGRSGVFSGTQGETEEGSWWIGKGVLGENDDNSSILELGFEVETPKLGFYLHSNFYNPNTADGIDKIGIETETHTGANLILLGKRRLGKDEASLALGYHNIDILVAEKMLKIQSLRNYLFLIRGGKVFQLALLGHEYIDSHADEVTGSDNLHGHFASILRLGLSSNSINIANGVDVDLGINSVFGVGTFRQQELIDWSSRSEFESAFLKLAANVDFILADGVVTIGFGGETARVEGSKNGEFFVGESIISTNLGIDLVPEYGIRLEGSSQLYHQRLTADGTNRVGDEDLSITNEGHRTFIFLVIEL